MSCGCNNNTAMADLAEMTDKEAIAIVKEEIFKDQIAILAEAMQGKTDTLAIATKRAVERICTVGVADKATTFIKDYWWAMAIGLGVVAWLILKK